MNRFHNKIAVITGAANGIGKALAIKSAAEGMKIVLADIDESGLEQLKAQLLEKQVEVVSQKIDIANLDDVQRLLSTTLEIFGQVDFLFNNAGIVGPIGPIWLIPQEELQRIFDINLMGMIYILRSFVPQMLKQDTVCHIINTSAVSGMVTYPYFSCYQMTKHAVVALSESLYHDLATHASKIKVSVLCPGWIKTNIRMSSHSYQTSENHSHHLEEYLNPDDIQWLIKFAKQVKTGMTPNELAEITFEAIKQDKFYIFSHPEMQKAIISRFNSIIKEINPAKLDVSG